MNVSIGFEHREVSGQMCRPKIRTNLDLEDLEPASEYQIFFVFVYKFLNALSITNTYSR